MTESLAGIARTMEEESQIEFEFGKFISQMRLDVVFKELSDICPGEPWLSSGLHAFAVMNIDHVGALLSLRLDETLTAFKSAKFLKPSRAASLLQASCDFEYLQPLADAATEAERALVSVQKSRDNVQKLTKYARTDTLDSTARKRIVLTLCATLGDLGPIARGSFINYSLQVEIYFRVVMVANHLLSDGSQRHNLDLDVREFVARWLECEYPIDGGWEKHDDLARRRMKNLRTASVKHPLPASNAAILYFNLTELIDEGHLIIPKEEAEGEEQTVLQRQYQVRVVRPMSLDVLMSKVRLSLAVGSLIHALGALSRAVEGLSRAMDGLSRSVEG